jgi:hypothetical protein
MNTPMPAHAQAIRIGLLCGGLWAGLWLAFVVDCRIAGGHQRACWAENPITPQVPAIERLLLAAGGAGLGGWLGFNTYNPSLRDPRQRDTLPPSSPPSE